MFGLFIILVLAAMGGCIAIIGDRVGMRIGKRRLSIFGLRPKHTSIVITAVTGIAIAMASVLLLALISSNVRTALFHLGDIQRALSRSRLQLERVNKEIHDQERLSEILARQIESLLRQQGK